MKRRGFTLIELLISIILMMILLFAVTMVFYRTTDTVAISEARIQVYLNARHAVDMLENDLQGTISFPDRPIPAGAPEPQSFWMENGVSGAPGNFPTYNVSGGHHTTAADRISFRTTTTVGDAIMTVQVLYELIPGDRALSPPAVSELPVPPQPTGGTQGGDSSHRKTVRTNRPLFTLVRRARIMNTANPNMWDQIPLDDTGAQIPDTELCHYVISMNLEYMANNMTLSQLEPSYFTSADPPSPVDPLGNGKGVNDLGVPPPGEPDPTQGPFRVPAVRITLVVVDDIGERQERTISRVIWIPTGS